MTIKGIFFKLYQLYIFCVENSLKNNNKQKNILLIIVTPKNFDPKKGYFWLKLGQNWKFSCIGFKNFDFKEILFLYILL